MASSNRVSSTKKKKKKKASKQTKKSASPGKISYCLLRNLTLGSNQDFNWLDSWQVENWRKPLDFQDALPKAGCYDLYPQPSALYS